MTVINEIYQCAVCGNVVEVMRTGSGTLVCCQQPMLLLTAKTKDEGNEKHVPVISKTETGYLVRVGSIPHPMEESHHIEWIELVADDKIYRKQLKPGFAAEAEFILQAENVSAREFCNLHGLWKS